LDGRKLVVVTIHNLLKDNVNTSIRQPAYDDMLWASMILKQATPPARKTETGYSQNNQSDDLTRQDTMIL
jgi:hypothetical protein